MEIMVNKNKIIEHETTVALGNFDGIHLGHRELINKTIDLSKENKTVPSIFTFDCNFNEFKIGSKNTSLMSKVQKESMLDDLGIELLYIVNFCDVIKNMTPEEFVTEILLKKLNARVVIVGFNFKFGHKANGNVETLSELSKKYRFEVIVIPPIIKDDNLVSSTLIRQLINKGDVVQANKLLGRNYSMRGKVIRGKGRGTNLGFATANLECDVDYVSPKNGVYDTIVKYNNKSYASITNIGINPTFADVGFSIETHIIDFKEDIYGEYIEVEFIDFIRPEKKFETVKDLVRKVKADIQEVKNRSN